MKNILKCSEMLGLLIIDIIRRANKTNLKHLGVKNNFRRAQHSTNNFLQTKSYLDSYEQLFSVHM